MGRLMAMPPADLNSAFSLAECRKMNGELKDRMSSYFSQLNDPELCMSIAYKNLKGEPHQTILSDILAHIVNHGSYHRGQIVSLVKKSGGQQVFVDYIGYVREEDAQK